MRDEEWGREFATAKVHRGCRVSRHGSTVVNRGWANTGTRHGARGAGRTHGALLLDGRFVVAGRREAGHSVGVWLFASAATARGQESASAASADPQDT